MPKTCEDHLGGGSCRLTLASTCMSARVGIGPGTTLAGHNQLRKRQERPGIESPQPGK